MAQVVHRPAILYDQERNPFCAVLYEEYSYTETQGERFCDPENPVKDLFVAGYGFVVGNVSKEISHLLILTAGA